MGKPDRHSAGRSSRVPFRAEEAAVERHDRRLKSNLSSAEEFRAACTPLGITLEIKNNGHHWVMRLGQNLAEWWPSSAKLVFDKKWNSGIHCHDIDQVFSQITGRWKVENRVE